MGGNISQPFEIQTGLRQGDALSPLLFNLVLEKVMRGVKRVDAGVPLGRLLRAFGYADDIDLVCKSEEGLRRMFGALETEGNGVGLVASEEKTKYMSISIPTCTPMKLLNKCHGIELSEEGLAVSN